MVCIDDEIPFEIPNGWAWCRFSSIYWQLTDGTHSTPKYTQSGIPFLSVKDMSSGKLSFANTKYISKEEHKLLSQRCHPCKGDLLLSKVGTTGIPLIIDDDREFSIFVSLALIKFFSEFIDSTFLIALLNSPLVQMQVKENTRGVGNKNWVLTAISNTLLAIPPLCEQQRIVDKIAALNPYTDRYAQSESKISHLNKEIGTNLMKSVLQEAIQGKLVPQEAFEEPASLLLQRIKEEKLLLVKEGKLKKTDFIDSTIFRGDDNKYFEKKGKEVVCIDDEIPFEIPDTWCWVRINYLFQTSSGGTPDKGHPEYYGGTIPWVKVGDLKAKTLDKSEETISPLGLENSSAKMFPKGTILVAMYCNDAIGKSSILSQPMATNQAICGLYPNPLVNKEYIYHVIQANRKYLQEQSAGGAQKNINQKIVNNLLLPLPPLAEQQRIVAKIEEFVASIMSR